MKNFAEFLEKTCQFFREKLKHLSTEQFFIPSVVDPSFGVCKNSKIYSNINGILAKRENWREKVDRLIVEGFSEIDVQGILSPSKEEEADYFLFGRIYFKASKNLAGQIDFLRKYVQEVQVKEFLICTHRINFEDEQYKLLEMTATWEDGINLIALSMKDFERNPEVFIRDRITKWKKKQKATTV